MPVEIEPPAVGQVARTPPQRDDRAEELIIGLVNNMPDTALHSTEIQFAGLLQAACGGRAVRLRLSALPGLPRSPEALGHMSRSYWSFEELLASPLDALIVTGTEPRAAVLTEEPYWQHFVQLLSFAREHTVASIWSCLAAHGAVLIMDGIERQRLPEKRCGVYQHAILSGHPLLDGVSAPLPMPHSRWNELPPGRLRAAGHTVLSWSDETGADAFVREERSVLLFFQGHPEYCAAGEFSVRPDRRFAREQLASLGGGALQQLAIAHHAAEMSYTETVSLLHHDRCPDRCPAASRDS